MICRLVKRYLSIQLKVDFVVVDNKHTVEALRICEYSVMLSTVYCFINSTVTWLNQWVS